VTASSPAPERVFVALGTNVGDRLRNLCEARRRLALMPGVQLLDGAHVIETPALRAPDDPLPQAPYLNTVLELRSALSPLELLQALLRLERSMGRRRSTRWAPRVIDLDLLLFGNRVINEPSLTLPHPGLSSRLFVLEPLAALAAPLLVPLLNRRVRDLLTVVRRAS
jgi:2-amino-4-hydroxy-6-hydroxymethyldihydropteridine diphosphokinase